MIALYSYISRALYPQKERRREEKHAGSWGLRLPQRADRKL